MKTAGELAQALGLDLSGDASAQISGVASIENATANDLVFAEDSAAVAQALSSVAGAVITLHGSDLKGRPGRAVLFGTNPRLNFARAAVLLAPAASTLEDGSIHPLAQVSPTAVLGKNVTVGVYVAIGGNSRIGNDTVLEAGCVIGSDTIIGAGCHLYPRVTVYPGTHIGENCIVHAGSVLGADGFGYVRDPATGEYIQFPQRGKLHIGNNVEIGANSTIDRGALEATVIGDACKLDNLVHVGHNVRIGRNVVIAAQTGISGSSVIGDNAVIAGQVGIADHVTIGEGAILGAQCGVPSNKKISGPGVLFWGTPARPIRQYLKELAALSRLGRR